MLHLFKKYYPVRNAFFVVGEGVFIFLSVMIASAILMDGNLFLPNQAILLKTCLITIVCQSSLYYFDLYDLNVTNSYQELFIRLLQSLGSSAIFLSLVYFVFPICIIGRGIFFFSICILIGFISLWRVAYTHVLNLGLFDKKIILLGSGDLAQNIAKAIESSRDCGYQVAQVINDDAQKAISSVEIGLNGYDNLCQEAKDHHIDKIVVAIEDRRSTFPTGQLLQCRVEGIEVLEGTSFYEMLTGKLIVENINPSWLIFSDGFRTSWLRSFIKRSVDLTLAVIMLTVLSPVLIATAILIKVDSKGPVFFSQERVGQNRKPYMVHKFRSMVDNAEKESGPVWAKNNDTRITRVGKFIRKWRIDEFPQLFNVIKGEMSFVGPRPEREFFVKELESQIPYYGERFSAKPGVTGWAQVCYSYGASVEDAVEKLKYDLFYIKNMSIFMDLMVIMRTVKTVLFGEGAR